MPALDTSTLNTVLALASQPTLDNPALPSTPLSLKLPGQSLPVGNFTLAVTAEASIAFINEPTDPDPTGFFNLGRSNDKAAENPDDAPALGPPAKFDPALAYVVVSGLRLGGKVGGKFTIGGSGTLGLDGSATLEAVACMAFARNTQTLAAATAALTQFKTVFSPTDLAALSVWGGGGQILSYGFQGNLGVSLSFTAASLAGPMAAAFNAALGSIGPIAIETDVAAKLTFNFSANDSFRVFAHRAMAGAVTFSIKKDTATTTALGATAGLKFEFDEKEVTALVNASFEKLADLTTGQLQTLLMGSGQATQILAILQKFGIANPLSNGIDTLNQTLGDLKAEFIKELTSTLTAQFSYSWKRLTSDSLVAQFTVPDAQIPVFHEDILALDLPKLMKDGVDAGIVFTQLLGRATTEVNVGYGFSFGVNDYTFLKGWDSLQRKFVETRQLGPGGEFGARQYAFLGKRGYDATWLGTTQSNYVELDASTAAPSVQRPALTDFQLGLSVAFTWKGQAFKDILDTVADHGCLIAALGTDDVLMAKQALLAKKVNPDATGEALVSVSVDDMGLRRLLDVLAGPDYADTLAPNALARSLSFSSDYPERANVTRRMQVYGQVFMNFLAAEDLDLDLLSRLCRDSLPRVTAGGKVSTVLANQEFLSRDLPWTVQGTLFNADRRDIQEAVNHELPMGFDLLRRSTGDFQQVLPECVSNFSTLGAQNYGCRVLASLLVLAASVTPGGLSLLTRTVQLSWTENQTRRTVVAKLN